MTASLRKNKTKAMTGGTSTKLGLEGLKTTIIKAKRADVAEIEKETENARNAIGGCATSAVEEVRQCAGNAKCYSLENRSTRSTRRVEKVQVIAGKVQVINKADAMKVQQKMGGGPVLRRGLSRLRRPGRGVQRSIHDSCRSVAKHGGLGARRYLLAPPEPIVHA